MGFENDMGSFSECDFANYELKKLVITGKTRAHCFVGERQFVESDKDSDSLTLNGIHSRCDIGVLSIFNFYSPNLGCFCILIHRHPTRSN
ncbi:hypothetical protein BLNAU_1167 [Blattamonas nauphoetae]|uniref:Deubiquitinating enzyme MINDY-3/4 conserved domain-containing protein n=1 Tax=Blattamonas nauphoetae TaxID=2049346 RepID=A0ABQ9X2E3_9EUKA|nr:hypothetical protein BLNAU_24462 [Blattamonas nauphoetae]KAK2945947.1 hypothetical protein BLNAU_19164 [Blattamonas nauphoetae]KAK2964086.1 hypothetical protein BLNAU_1167 [Blattamonas nauphoetae]